MFLFKLFTMLLTEPPPIGLLCPLDTLGPRTADAWPEPARRIEVRAELSGWSSLMVGECAEGEGEREPSKRLSRLSLFCGVGGMTDILLLPGEPVYAGEEGPE